MRNSTILLTVLYVFGMHSPLLAGDFASTEGLKFSYSAEWKAASDKQLIELAKQLGDSHTKLLAYISAPPSENYAPNIGVILIPRPGFGATRADEDAFVKDITDDLTANGVKAPEVKTSHIDVGGRTVFSIAYEKINPPTKSLLRCWAVLLKGKTGACIIDCSALKSQWKTAVPEFKSVVNGITFDDSPVK